MTERYRTSVGIGMTFVPVHFLSMAVLWGRPAGWNKDIPSEHVFFFKDEAYLRSDSEAFFRTNV